MKFDLKKTLLCSLAFGWISLFWGSYDSFLQVIDYGVFGMDAVWHGVIIASDNILGLLLLPLFGRLSDKTTSRLGKRSPYIIGGTVVECAAFLGACIFATLASLDGTQSVSNPYFAPFLVCLMLTLASMSAYRSPALALVPDINIDKFRSRANAVSNIVSVVFTVLALLFYFFFVRDSLFGNDAYGDYQYLAFGGVTAITSLVMMIVFASKVNEPKLLDGMAAQKAAAEQEEQTLAKQKQLEENLKNMSANELDSAPLAYSKKYALDVVEAKTDDENYLSLPSFDAALHYTSFDIKRNRKARLDRRERAEREKVVLPFYKRASFTRGAILFVVFCFYMAYNALTSNFIAYAKTIFGFASSDAVIPLLLAEVAAMLAFPLASMLAGKIGRKWTIFLGFAVMIAAFASSVVFSVMPDGGSHPSLYVVFIALGVSFGLVMVNIYPFFLELSPPDKLGVNTGIFSFAMMLAMVVTPILSGVLIDALNPVFAAKGWFGGSAQAGFGILFPYSIFFLLLAFATTAIIKNTTPHTNDKKGLEAFDVD